MTWQVTWSLTLGFTLSAVMETPVRKSTIAGLLPDDLPRSGATATGLGAAPSSCSYAATAGEAAFAGSLGCGVPTAVADLHPGEVVSCANTRLHALTWAFVGSSCGPVVLVDQPAEHLPALDAGGQVDHLIGVVVRPQLAATSVRPVLVVVPLVAGEHSAQVPLTRDEQVVEALAA
jgi:hypothetical protein